MKSKENEDNTDEEDSQKTDNDNNAEGEAVDADEPERFERPDNLRRRSEWFQKRTGGR